jgi:hypothetical protein
VQEKAELVAAGYEPELLQELLLEATASCRSSVASILKKLPLQNFVAAEVSSCAASGVLVHAVMQRVKTCVASILKGFQHKASRDRGGRLGGAAGGVVLLGRGGNRGVVKVG